MEVLHSSHCSVETMKTVLVGGPLGLMAPPTKMTSPPSNCVAAAKDRGTGRSPLDILNHELALGEYMWTAEDGESLSSSPPIAMRQPPSSAAVEYQSGHSGRTCHVGGEGEAWGVLLVSGWSGGRAREIRLDTDVQ